MNNALGIDTAGCNGQINWDIAQAHGVVFGAARATISWGYQDKWFPHNWASMKDRQIHRFAYHVLYPSQPIQSQVDNFLRVVANDWVDAFPVLDVELDQDYSSAGITDAIINWSNLVAKHAPKPLIYSRKQWIEQYTIAGNWRAMFDWWLAQYLNPAVEDTRPPDLPVFVKTWLIHQNADHFIAWPGLSPDSINVDIDRWNGDKATVDAYFKGLPVPADDWQHSIDKWARTMGYTGPEPV